MTTLEERAPGYFMTPTERDALSDLLARAERISTDLADAYRAAQRIVTGTTDLNPTVDLGDPLAMYRLPSGAVGYVEEAARWVQKGDYVQAVHGDEGRWEQVIATVRADTQTGITTTDGTRTHLRWWNHEDRVRVATAPVPDPTPYREDRADAIHRAETGGL